MDQEKVVFEGSERKKAFLDQKNIGSKNYQNFNFFEKVSTWFLSKNGDFLILSFYAKWIKKKCFLNSRKEKKSLKKRQKFAFFQRGYDFLWFLSKNGDFLIFSFYTKWINKKCF